ncbi:MAG: hypothetical protein JWP44_3435 [Mucilaginibacter sp.]|nr:hypothetical protein [Mucilaginibacter sp.]
MKKLILLSAIAMSGLIYSTANAQVGLHVGFNFGPARVVQVPVYDDDEDDYYYLPDVDAYYSVNEECYYYYNGYRWVPAAYLPGAFRYYDWRNADRYEVRAPRPYLHDDVYRSRYHGRPVTEWTRNEYENHYNNGYVNRGREDQHFDRRAEGYNQHFDNHEQRSFDRPAQQYREGERNNQRFDNHEQRGYNQPLQPRGDGGNFQHFDNRAQQGGFNQRSNQNDGHINDARGNDARGGNQHGVQSYQVAGSANQR